MKTLLCIAMILLLSGCRGTLPAVAWQTQSDALAVLAARGQSIEPLSATARVTLDRPEGSSITMESVLLSHGDRFRLRGWKFQQPVLDLTLNEEGLFVWMAERGESTDPQLQKLSAEHVREAWRLIRGDLFAEPPVEWIEDKREVGARYKLGDAEAIAWIDRRTLTVQRYEVFDSEGVLRQRVRMQRYRLIEGVPWPSVAEASGPAGTIRIRFDEVEFHADLPDSAWQPPRRAVRQP